MGTLEGKVAFITGAARGQGRSHAVRLAGEGADIVAVDICHDIDTMDYPNANSADLAETVTLVEALDRRILAREVDVRDAAGLRAVADEGFATFGRIDIVLSNAGIVRLSPEPDADFAARTWADILGTNLTGGYHTAAATIPHLIAGGRGGSIVFTGSTAGTRPSASTTGSGLAYVAAKTALVGITKALAAELAQHSIRVNVVHPTGVVSGMTMNEAMGRLMAEASAGGSNTISAMQNALPVDILQPSDISDAIAFLVSDQAKYITGVSLPVDAGFSVR